MTVAKLTMDFRGNVAAALASMGPADTSQAEKEGGREGGGGEALAA